MIDVKKVRQALLKAFNKAELPLERYARDVSLDTVLGQYFSKASYMLRELTLEAIVSLLRNDRSDSDVSHKRVKEILDSYS